MNRIWFITAKIKMSKTMFSSWLESEASAPENVVFEEGCQYAENVFRDFREVSGFPDEGLTTAAFFAEEIVRARLSDHKDVFMIRYDDDTGRVEIVRSVTSPDRRTAVLNAVVICSAANYKSDGEKNVVAISEGELGALKHIFEILPKTVKVVPPDMRAASMPEDMETLYRKAENAFRADVLSNAGVDAGILREFATRARRAVSRSRLEILSLASTENHEILTEDALYSTDGSSVLDVYGLPVEPADPETFESSGNGYGKDAKSVYYGRSKIESADPSSFDVLQWGYAKDKIRAYFDGRVLEGASPEKFKSLKPACGYASDGRKVYYKGRPVEGADSETFYFVGEGRENDAIYFGADKSRIYLDGEPVPGIDPKRFEHVGKKFFRDEKLVYCVTKPVEGCAPETVRVFNACYITDYRHVFFIGGGEEVKGGDPASFRVNGLLAADDRRIYYKGKEVPGSDGASADISDPEGDGYVKDAFSVFCFDRKIPVSPSTFQTLGFGYARDGAAVFFRDRLIPHADASTFRPTSYGSAFDKFAKYACEKQYSKKFARDLVNVTGTYFKDDSTVYYGNVPVEGAEPATFAPVEKDYGDDIFVTGDGLLDLLSSEEEKSADRESANYAKDARRVYYKGRPVDGADAETFEILERNFLYALSSSDQKRNTYGRDKYAVYYKGVGIRGAVAAGFAPYRIRNLWRDGNNFYMDGGVVDYIDYKTFAHLEYSFYADKNGAFYETAPLEGLEPSGLTVLAPEYIKDEKHFCYVEATGSGTVEARIFEADSNSFDIIESEPVFSFDKKGLFFKGRSIREADMSTVEFIGHGYIRDKNRIFYGDLPVEGAKIPGFTPLGDDYAYDGSSSFYRATVLDTNRIVHILGAGYATDGTLFWHRGAPVNDPASNRYIAESLGWVF